MAITLDAERPTHKLDAGQLETAHTPVKQPEGDVGLFRVELRQEPSRATTLIKQLHHKIGVVRFPVAPEVFQPLNIGLAVGE